MKVIEFIIKGLREIVTRSTGYPSDRAVDFSRVDYFDEVANDYIFSRIDEALNNQTGPMQVRLHRISQYSSQNQS